MPEEFSTSDLQDWLDFADQNQNINLLTGTPVLFDYIGKTVLKAQKVSLLSAFGLVFIMLLLVYRRIGLTFLSLLPIALAVATLLGFLAAANIHLNLITAIASGIVIGVGIDYAIHFTAALDYARRESSRGYVLKALESAGRPILANALGVALGMSGLIASPFMPHTHISMIMWVAMTVSSVGTIVLIPAFLPKEAKLN